MTTKGVSKQIVVTRRKGGGFRSAARACGLSLQIGKDAVESSYRAQIEVCQGGEFTGSVDMDAHFLVAEPHGHRWDYGIGILTSNGQELACWVEPHPASSTGQVSKMLEKLAWLKKKLNTTEFKKLRAMTYVPGRTGSPYYWLRTVRGECRILAGSREAKLLAQHGLRMPAQLLILP